MGFGSSGKGNSEEVKYAIDGISRGENVKSSFGLEIPMDHASKQMEPQLMIEQICINNTSINHRTLEVEHDRCFCFGVSGEGRGQRNK